MPSENTVYELGYTEEVGCYFCQKELNNTSNSYKRGEAFLAGAGHSPFDANANYICKDHLDDDAVVYDPDEHFGDVFAIEDAIKNLISAGVNADAAKARVHSNYERLKLTEQFISDSDLTQ